MNLQGSSFRHLSNSLTLDMLEACSFALSVEDTSSSLSQENQGIIDACHAYLFKGYGGFSLHDIRRLDAYSRNLIDYHLILDLVPKIAKCVFLIPATFSNLLPWTFTALQRVILVSVGLKGDTIENVGSEFVLPMSQVLALFNKLVKKFTKTLRNFLEIRVERELKSDNVSSLKKINGKHIAPSSNLSTFEKQDIAGAKVIERHLRNSIQPDEGSINTVRESKIHQQEKFHNKKRKHKR